MPWTSAMTVTSESTPRPVKSTPPVASAVARRPRPGDVLNLVECERLTGFTVEAVAPVVHTVYAKCLLEQS